MGNYFFVSRGIANVERNIKEKLGLVESLWNLPVGFTNNLAPTSTGTIHAYLELTAPRRCVHNVITVLSKFLCREHIRISLSSHSPWWEHLPSVSPPFKVTSTPQKYIKYDPNFPPSFYPRAKHFYFSPQPGTQRSMFLTDFSHHLKQGLLRVSQFTILTSVLKPKLHAKCHTRLK